VNTHPIPFIRPLRPAALAIADGVLAVGLTLADVYSATAAPIGGPIEPTWLCWLVGLGLGLPLVVRRRWPVPVTVVITTVAIAATLSSIIPDYAGAAPGISIACALYVVGLSCPARPSLLAASFGVVGMSLAVFTASRLSDHPTVPSSVALSGLLPALGWIIGLAVRERREHAAWRFEQRTNEAVQDERLRIARELHDIVAHSMTLIAVKAAVANHVADDRPQETRAALGIIETTSRQALVELRRALGVLRTSAPNAPTPGLDDLLAVAERARMVGLRVDLTLPPAGPARSDMGVPDGWELATYCIVQESLTNVVRHARATRCTVTVGLESGGVRIRVTDDGPASLPAPVDGHGILGMRERAELYGGELTAGPDPAGGFVVMAWLPTGSSLTGPVA